MSKPTVFVIGASGNVGTATLKALSSKFRSTLKIKAGVRNPEKAQSLKDLPGVILVKATMGEESLVKTLAGVRILFIVSPTSENRVCLVNSTADYAKKARVTHLVVISTTAADLPEFTLGKHFYDIEKYISKLGVLYTFIRLPFFFENLFALKGFIAIYYSVDPEVKFSSVAVEDAGKASAAILADVATYINKTVTVISDFQSYTDIVRELSVTLERDISYIQQPVETIQKSFLKIGLPEWQITGLLEFVKIINDSNPAFATGNVSTYTEITGENPTTLKEWVSKNSALFTV